MRLLIALAVGLSAVGAGCGAQGGEERTITIRPGDEGDRGADGGGSARDGAAADQCDGAATVPKSDNLDQVEQATLCLVNIERRERGRSPLEPHRLLAGPARRKAREMVEQSYFAHVSPDGDDVTDWIRGTGYLPERGGWNLGENIGWGESEAGTPARIVRGWMNSRSHRRNILSRDFAHSGVGIWPGAPREGASGSTYVHFFGSRQPPG